MWKRAGLIAAVALGAVLALSACGSGGTSTSGSSGGTTSSTTTNGGQGTSGSTTTAAADVQAGMKLFQSDCAVCHGQDGSGGKQIGSVKSADLRQSALEPAYHNNTQLLERAILDGLDEDGEALDSAMPRWKGSLTKQQVDDIIAYLKTLK